MLDLVKEIILDFQASVLETGVPRRLATRAMPGKAAICIGARRSGKSTYMFQLMQRLLDSGVSRQNILYLNFFDDRLHALQRQGLGVISEAYYSLYPEKKGTEKVYCYFDEIQTVAGWEPFVDRMLRSEKCEIYITGSSAGMLSREIATQMRGRSLSWEIFPFSFREFLDFKKIKSDGDLSSKQRLLIQKAFGEYWERGGFPEVVAVDRQLRIKTHQEYFNAMLFRDIVERHDISHPRAVADLAHWLVDNTASQYTVNSLTGYLKSLGHKAPKSAVSEYLGWFEDAYFLFTVRLFDASLSRSNANPKKIYCIDHSLATSVGSGILLNSGKMLENLVYMALRRVEPELFYYRTKNNREVDFLVNSRECPRMLIQVCEAMADDKTRKREMTAVTEAMAELKLNKGYIVTRNEDGLVKVDNGEVEILPAWRFLLRNSQ